MSPFVKLRNTAESLRRSPEQLLRRPTVLLFAVAAVAGVIGYFTPASGQADEEAAPVFVDKVPAGYRDWPVISVAHEEGNLHSIGAVLGNDVAIKAYREGTLPFPDGAIIAALHWRHTPSEENNKSLAVPNPSSPALRRTSSSWSRTQRSTPRPAAGASLISTVAKTSRPKRRFSNRAFPVTRAAKITTWSSPVTHRDPSSGATPTALRRRANPLDV